MSKKPTYAELAARVKELEAEKEALEAKNQDLTVKNRTLEETNEGLRRFLEEARQVASDQEARFKSNAEDLVLPYVRRLQKGPLSLELRVLANVVAANLEEITAPFARKLTSETAGLTPREIQVAELVRLGTTSKEIARIIGISKRAVEFHRDSLRKKLGLKKSKKNLRAFLAAMS